jgi:serine/threonine protein kinase
MNHIAAALAYMHDQGVVYNALDDTTVRVGATAEGFEAKLVDFARSDILDTSFDSAADPNDHTAKAQSPYAAPDRILSYKSDVFSFGVLGRKLFCPGDSIFVAPPLRAGTPLPPCPHDVDERHPPTLSALSVLFDWCTTQRPCERPTMAEVLDFLTNLGDHTLDDLLHRRAHQVAAHRSENCKISLPWPRMGYRHSDWLESGAVFEMCRELVEDSRRTPGAVLQLLSVALVKPTSHTTTAALDPTQLPRQMVPFITPAENSRCCLYNFFATDSPHPDSTGDNAVVPPGDDSRCCLYTFFATDDLHLDHTLGNVLQPPIHIAQPFGRGVAAAMEPLHARELLAETVTCSTPSPTRMLRRCETVSTRISFPFVVSKGAHGKRRPAMHNPRRTKSSSGPGHCCHPWQW